MTNDKESIRLSLLAMEETARGVTAEPRSDRSASRGTASPAFLRQLNNRLRQVNELVPGANLTLFDDTSSPIQASYPRGLELLQQIKLAIAFLGPSESAKPDDQSARGRRSGSFTVFVCSTFSDLSQEREGVLDAIRRLKLQHESMEFFGARAEQPIETCLQEIRASDTLVVIVGHRYGTIVPDLGISYSEAEYAEGFRLKKPCLVYMRNENVPVLPRYMERDPEKLKLLEKWKKTLQSRHTVASFEDGGRLAVQVAADLARTIQDLEEVAKARATARSEGGAALLTEVQAS